MQIRKSLTSESWDVMIESGREKSNKKLPEWIEEVQQRGAGEIIITSIDNDGTGNGPDLDLLNEISKYVSVPLIFGGGVSSKKDICNLINLNNKISGISIGWALHNKKINVNEVKNCINSLNFPMRYCERVSSNIFKKNLTISIVDYSMGNVRSLYNSLKNFSNNVHITNNEELLYKSDLVALPGVGSFPEGMKNLRKRNLIKVLKKRAEDNKAILGICLGMQLLYNEGEENQACEGLKIINRKITKLPTLDSDNKSLILPHVGWNKVYLAHDNKNLLSNLGSDFYQYFVHSFADCIDIQNNKYALFETSYGNTKFISGIKKGNIIGLQFHPERSGEKGLFLLNKIISLITNN